MNALDRFASPRTRERAVFSLAAAVLGLGAGLGVLGFRKLIDVSHAAAWDHLARVLESVGAWTTVLVPVVGGLVAGAVVHWLIGPERHHGVAGIIEAVALDGGRLRWWRAPGKVLAAAVSIGSGASVGPEDPSVQIGSNLGSFLGQRLGLADDRVRVLVAAGAAAGVSAAFGAPIAGVFFALEIVLADLAGTGLGIILVTSVLASVFMREAGSTESTFVAPVYQLRSAWELPWYLLLGLVAGPVAALYVRAVDGARAWYGRSRIPVWLRPATAGLAVGIVALALPQVRAVGYPHMEAMLRDGGPALTVLLGLVAAKLVLTALCIGAGFPGGVFAPGLFIGCTLGAAFGQVLRASGVAPDVQPGAFAMVGMAAVLAPSVHAPLTAVLLLFETTHDDHILLPAMGAVAAAMFAARLIERESVYSRPLVRKGFRRHPLAPIETERATVGEGAPCAGRLVREVAWPASCVIGRVRRGAESIAPHGDTRLLPGDEVVAVVDDAGRGAFRALCRGTTEGPS